MFFVLLFLVGATATLTLFPQWSTAMALLVPLAVVVTLRLALVFLPKNADRPR